VEERGAELQVTVPTALPAVRFDEGLVVRVLQNLLGNAARYVPRGGLVEVQLSGGSEGVTLSVGNDGPKIPPEQQAHLFDKFGQVNEGQETDNRGLGLYFCRLVAERHGGQIAVRDRDAGGVRFDLVLPLVPMA
jgi:signal transduction histidine kinase